MRDSEPSVSLVVLLAVVRRDICGERGFGWVGCVGLMAVAVMHVDGWAEACSGTPSPQLFLYVVWSKQTEISYASLFTAPPARYSDDVAQHVFVILKCC
jgi:hypothetical protein